MMQTIALCILVIWVFVQQLAIHDLQASVVTLTKNQTELVALDDRMLTMISKVAGVTTK